NQDEQNILNNIQSSTQKRERPRIVELVSMKLNKAKAANTKNIKRESINL
ncbi:14927_t:CDS:1, partial [Racocetra persica]